MPNNQEHISQSNSATTDCDSMSEAVSEIISVQPGFMVRNGITIFFIILVICLLMCRFIHYPDIVYANAKLTSINAPKEIKAKTSGRLTDILVNENDSVDEGEIIGFMESLADPYAIIRLSANVDSVAVVCSQSKIIISPACFKSVLSFAENGTGLGELQADYQTFIQAYQTFADYMANGFYAKKKWMLNTDLENINLQHQNLLFQYDLQKQDLELTQKTFEANDTLKKQKVISDFDYRTEQSKLLNKKLSLPQLNASLLSNEAQQNDKKKEMLQLENEFIRQKQIFIQALKTFQNKINEWKKTYLLIAPVSGNISFTNLIEKNQQLDAGQTICFVKPTNTDLYAVLYLSQYNFGKVKTGQKVLLKFPAYPYTQFGSVEGEVDFISHIPADSFFLAKVKLSKGLVTNYQNRIQYRNGLTAQCNIITENMSLLQRLYQNFLGYTSR